MHLITSDPTDEFWMSPLLLGSARSTCTIAKSTVLYTLIQFYYERALPSFSRPPIIIALLESCLETRPRLLLRTPLHFPYGRKIQKTASFSTASFSNSLAVCPSVYGDTLGGGFSWVLGVLINPFSTAGWSIPALSFLLSVGTPNYFPPLPLPPSRMVSAGK